MSQSDAERRGAEQRGSVEERLSSSKAVGGVHSQPRDLEEFINEIK